MSIIWQRDAPERVVAPYNRRHSRRAPSRVDSKTRTDRNDGSHRKDLDLVREFVRLAKFAGILMVMSPRQRQSGRAVQKRDEPAPSTTQSLGIALRGVPPIRGIFEKCLSP